MSRGKPFAPSLVKRTKEVVVVVDSCCSLEGELNAVAFCRAGVRTILVDKNLDGAARAARHLNMMMGWDPVEPGKSSRVVAARVGELNAGTAPSLAELALREFGRLPDAVADANGGVSEEFLRWMREARGVGSSDAGSMRVVLDYKTEFASEASHLEQDVLAERRRAGRMVLKDLPGRHPCLHALFPKELLSGQAARVLDVERVRSCSCVVMTNNPISFLLHVLSGNTSCPPYRIGRIGGPICTMFIEKSTEKNLAEIRNREHTRLQESLKVIGTENVLNNDCVPQQVDEKCFDEHEKGHVEFFEKPIESLQEPLQHKETANKLNNSLAFRKVAMKESNPEDDVLAVLDCRCQYEIIQRRVKRSIRWAFLGYVVVMSAIPSILLGSSTRY